MKLLEQWQVSCEGVTERRIRDLTDTVDDLTTLAHSRDGMRVLRSQHLELIGNLRKLHDLVMDTEPTMQAFNNVIAMVREDAR